MAAASVVASSAWFPRNVTAVTVRSAAGSCAAKPRTGSATRAISSHRLTRRGRASERGGVPPDEPEASEGDRP